MKNGRGTRTVEHVFGDVVEINWANRNRNTPETWQGSTCMSDNLPKIYKAVPFQEVGLDPVYFYFTV